VASLFTEEDRPGTPYGFRSGQSPEELQPEPHEQMLLMQGGGLELPVFPTCKWNYLGQNGQQNLSYPIVVEERWRFLNVCSG